MNLKKSFTRPINVEIQLKKIKCRPSYLINDPSTSSPPPAHHPPSITHTQTHTHSFILRLNSKVLKDPQCHFFSIPFPCFKLWGKSSASCNSNPSPQQSDTVAHASSLMNLDEPNKLSNKLKYHYHLFTRHGHLLRTNNLFFGFIAFG